MQRLSHARQLSGSLASSLPNFVPVSAFAKKARAAPPEEDRSKDSRTQKLLKLLEPAPEVTIELSPEDATEWERRAKEYNRRSMQAHREWQRDLTTRLKLKNAALAALPPALREAAMAPPDELFPLDRMIFTHTPPKPQEVKREAGGERKGVRLGTRHMK